MKPKKLIVLWKRYVIDGGGLFFFFTNFSLLLLLQFAKHYCAQNPDCFPHEDIAYMLSFSLIMLNTDLHNPNIKVKIYLS